SENDRNPRIDGSINANSSAQFGREGYHNSGYEPDRQSYQNTLQVSEESLAMIKQHKEVATLHVIGFGLQEHARLEHANPHHQQNESQPSADKIGRAPFKDIGNEISQNSAEYTKGGHECCTVSANLPG